MRHVAIYPSARSREAHSRRPCLSLLNLRNLQVAGVALAEAAHKCLVVHHVQNVLDRLEPEGTLPHVVVRVQWVIYVHLRGHKVIHILKYLFWWVNRINCISKEIHNWKDIISFMLESWPWTGNPIVLRVKFSIVFHEFQQSFSQIYLIYLQWLVLDLQERNNHQE